MILNVVYVIAFISIFGCVPKSNKVYFCNEYTNKFIRLTIGNDYELLTNPDLKNYINISLRYQNKNYNEIQNVYFGTKLADLYTNGLKHSDNDFAALVRGGIQEDDTIDSIYQINCLKIKEINYVTYSITKKKMGHNIWFESIHFNLNDSIVLWVSTADFDINNNFEFVQSKHFDLLNSIEFGVCYE